MFVATPVSIEVFIEYLTPCL